MNDATSQPATGRRGDGVLVVSQHNADKTLLIRRANEAACNLLGYAEGELNDTPLQAVLGQRLLETLDEDLEYADDAPDVGELLSRQRELRLRHRMGNELAQDATVARLVAEGGDATFQIVLPNEVEIRSQKQLRDFLKLNLEGRQQIEASTGLPDRSTAEAYIGLLSNYTASNGMEAAFAVIRLDRHDKSVARYGRDACVELVRHVGNCCRSTFREEDMVCALSDHTLGLMLLDISRESVRVVLNRLRWNVRNHRIDFGGKSDFSVTISVSFDMLDAHHADSLLSRCEQAANDLDHDTRNYLIELGH
jgi:GGDEF domain-containing protein